MGFPTFRFVAWSNGKPTVDAQFWRDVDASDRLASRFKANLYLRELCRSKAWEDASGMGDSDPFDREERERSLLREVLARGYRLSGPDLEELSSIGWRESA